MYLVYSSITHTNDTSCSLVTMKGERHESPWIYLRTPQCFASIDDDAPKWITRRLSVRQWTYPCRYYVADPDPAFTFSKVFFEANEGSTRSVFHRKKKHVKLIPQAAVPPPRIRLLVEKRTHASFAVIRRCSRYK